MSKKLFLGLLILNLMVQPLSAQFSFSEVQFWIGSGTDSTLLVIDFNDGTTDSSYAWGYAYSGNETGEDLLNAVAVADANLSIAAAGGFLNDVIYGQHSGIGGQPDYWSTWSGSDTASLVMNSGLATPLVDGEWFALSYTDFSPAAVPGVPIAAFNPESFDFSQVDQWIGSGSDSMALFIDFQLADSGQVVFGYLFNDSVQASQILQDLDQAVAALSVNAGSFLNDISYQNWSGIGGQPNYWSTWSATNVGNWYMNAGIGSYVKAGELFGCSYTDFAPALRPRVPTSDLGIGLDETELLPFAIYPNPAQDYLNISSEQNGQLQVYNQQGALLLSQLFDGQAQLDLSDWAAGLYFVQLNGKSQRLIIH